MKHDVDDAAGRRADWNLGHSAPGGGEIAEYRLEDRRLGPVPDRRTRIRVQTNAEVGAQRSGNGLQDGQARLAQAALDQ